MRHSLLAALMLLAVLTSGCRLRTAVDLVVFADGGGTLEVLLAADAELAEDLRAGGSDPLAGIDRIAGETWTVTSTSDDAQGVTVVLGTEFSRPEDLARRVAELEQDLGAAGGKVAESLTLRRSDDGLWLVEGVLGLLPPTVAGAEGAEIDVDADDLLAFLRRQGDEVARHDLRVTMPEDITSSNADDTIGRTAAWRLPVGDVRSITVSSPGDEFPIGLAVGAGITAAALAGGAAFFLRRRRAA